MEVKAVLMTEYGRVIEFRMDKIEAENLAFNIPTEVVHEKSVISMQGILYRYTPRPRNSDRIMSIRKLLKARRRLENKLERLSYVQELEKAHKAVSVHAAIKAEVERLSSERDAAVSRAEKLQAFKDFVHHRLDEIDVPKHPDGEHSKAGCRIGDRLDIVAMIKAERDTTRAAHAEAHRLVVQWCKDSRGPYPERDAYLAKYQNKDDARIIAKRDRLAELLTLSNARLREYLHEITCREYDPTPDHQCVTELIALNDEALAELDKEKT